MIGIVALALSSFTHIVVIVQENRTPDNLFYALCVTQPCSTTDPAQYDIQTANWNVEGHPMRPMPVPLANGYDLGHTHPDWVHECDATGKDGEANTRLPGKHNAQPPAYESGACLMDGWDKETCLAACISSLLPAVRYVDNSAKVIQPYLDLATQYGWANLMFSTQQGPSLPGHQFIFGGTSAPNAPDDGIGTFVSENGAALGCNSPPLSRIQLIDAYGNEDQSNTVYPCYERTTLTDMLDQIGATWKYYAVGQGPLWNAPESVLHICQPLNNRCQGQYWTTHVDETPADVLTDIQNCNLPAVTWVTPTGPESDHPGTNQGLGPSWVASIYNAIGQSKCVDTNGLTYWQNTAIIVTWDDWGGWYDHEPPQVLGFPQGGYQYGFRVPLIFISAYTPQGYIDNNRLDFGSIIRFVEGNFGMPEGALGFADARAASDLSSFYHLQAPARAFMPIAAPHNARYFLKHRCRARCAPDTD